MAITILEIHQMDGYHDRHFSLVRHNGHELEAVLVGSYDHLLGLLHTDITAEYELNEITHVKSDLPRSDQDSGIFSLDGGAIFVDGTVHNELVIDNVFSMFDIHLQNEDDFLCLTSDDLSKKPQLGSRIQITGKGLIIYPCLT